VFECLLHRVDRCLDRRVRPRQLPAEELVVLVGAGLPYVDALEPVGESPRVAGAEAERCLALALDVTEKLGERIPVGSRLDTERLELVRPVPDRALAVELHHDRVLVPVDLTDLENARRVVRLERVHVDPEIGDLLEGALSRELTKEADARDDRDVSRVAAGDARLQRRRVVGTDRPVLRGAPGPACDGGAASTADRVYRSPLFGDPRHNIHLMGTFVLALHSHLPYCRGAGRWPHGEEWIHEAVLGTYLPLLVLLQDLREAGVPYRIVI